MKSDITVISGRKIFYRYAGDAGIPVVFVHGNSFSSRAFGKQLDGPLSERYRLFAPDLPGHGNSEDAAEPEIEYTLRGFAELLAGFVTVLDIDDAVFVGWSLGGHIILEAADLLPKARGFMISGTPPLGASESSQPPFYPDSAAEATLKRELSEEDRESLLKALFGKEGTVIPEFFRKDLERADGRVREVIGVSAQRGDFRDEVAIVRNMETPLALVHGREDGLVNPEYLRDIEYGNLYRNRIIDIPLAGHTPQWEQPGRFESVLDDFIKANCGG